jgi:hypothetical protein
MMCRTSPRFASILTLGLLASLARAGAARAETAAAPAAEAEPAGGEMPAPTETEAPGAEPEGEDGTPLVGTVAAAPRRARDVSYGVAYRLRWVSVPKWMLNAFTTQNVPLSSWATALEFFRRKGAFDFIVSVGYQDMSPSDGNWLGRGHDGSVDTDYVQFKDLAFWGIDASFVWHTFFNDWVGIHYGAGIGLGIVTGHMYRTSDGTPGCSTNPGDVNACHPVGATCANGFCTDKELNALNPTGNASTDTNLTPHRFADGNVPSAIPIVNVLVGVDFRLPNVRGWEARLEGGFYDAFFLGGTVAYTF